MVGGIAASLQALAPLLVLALLIGNRPDRRAWRVLPGLGSMLLWLPFWVPKAFEYAGSPWYEPGSWLRWGTIGDGLLGSVGLLLALGWTRPTWQKSLPLLLCIGTLVVLERSGFGVEIQKIGISLTVLWMMLGEKGALVILLGFIGSSAPPVVRPDLREAAEAVAGSPYPVVSVFASETAFYLRNPQPLPSDREPAQIRKRLEREVQELPTPCLWAIHLPGTVPEDLGSLRTLTVAPVTGLDVRLVGTMDCQGSPQ